MATALDLLPDVKFCQSDPTSIANGIIIGFEAASAAAGFPVSLAPGDMRRLFLLYLASLFTIERGINNFTGQQNLLKYSEAPNIDELGGFWGPNGIRPISAPSFVTIQYTLAVPQGGDTVIPIGTQVGVNNLIWANIADIPVPAGQTVVTGTAQSTINGAIYNGYAPGQINTLVTWSQGFAVQVTNTTVSEGGADVSTDPQYRELLYLVPFSLAVAGPEGQYQFWIHKFSSAIVSSQVWSKELASGLLADGGRVEIAVLLTGGVIPDSSFNTALQAFLSPDNIRPLTDFPEVITATQVTYNESFTYYIARENAANVTGIQQKVTNAVLAWELKISTTLGWNISPSALDAACVDAGASRTTLGQTGGQSYFFNNPLQLKFTATALSYGYVRSRASTDTHDYPIVPRARSSGRCEIVVRLLALGSQPQFIAMGNGQVGVRGFQNINYGGLESGA